MSNYQSVISDLEDIVVPGRRERENIITIVKVDHHHHHIVKKKRKKNGKREKNLEKKLNDKREKWLKMLVLICQNIF